MARIALDCDGVLYRFVPALRDFIFISTGRPLEEMPDADNWSFYENQWGYTLEEYKDFMIKGLEANMLMWYGEEEENASWGVKELYNIGHHITVITARNFPGYEDMGRWSTEYWLASHNIPYHDLILSSKKIGYGFDCLIDDAPHNIAQLTEAGECAVIFDQPWNRHVEHEHRVYDWIDVVNFIEKTFD